MNLILLNRIKSKLLRFRSLSHSTKKLKPLWKVLFFGSDDFSVYSLSELCSEYRKGSLVEQLEVVTSLRGKPNAVRVFSEKEKLVLHDWPPRLDHGRYDVGLVVSFGHLIPENIIEKFHYGMLNVHASLLPRWRGAAPIIYALAQGDTRTGITIMEISPRKFDIGNIIAQKSVEITPEMRRTQLVSILGQIGGCKLIETLENLPENLENSKPQPSIGITYAPKIDASFGAINWNQMSSKDIRNLDRALDGIVPIYTTWKDTPLKLMEINVLEENTSDLKDLEPGFITYDKKLNVLRILCKDSKWITVKKVGIPGRTVMSAKDFNNGFMKKESRECRMCK